jgi:hypothetical protein
MLEGNTRHRDSLGNTGVIGPGSAQWMTSGRGILHEEMPKRGPEGTVYGFQLWVNLPAALKMSTPRYQDIHSDNIPELEKDGQKVRLVAGEYAGLKGSATEIAIQPLYMDVTLDPNVEFSLPIAPGNAVYAYLFEGEAILGMDANGRGKMVEAVSMVVFGDGQYVRIQAVENSTARFILMAGKPINEAIVPYGPFVMNTEQEIEQAFIDLRNGTFVQD